MKTCSQMLVTLSKVPCGRKYGSEGNRQSRRREGAVKIGRGVETWSRPGGKDKTQKHSTNWDTVKISANIAKTCNALQGKPTICK